MKIFILIIFLSCVIGRLLLLTKEENWTFSNVVVTVCYIVAYVGLCNYFLTFK